MHKNNQAKLKASVCISARVRSICLSMFHKRDFTENFSPPTSALLPLSACEPHHDVITHRKCHIKL